MHDSHTDTRTSKEIPTNPIITRFDEVGRIVHVICCERPPNVLAYRPDGGRDSIQPENFTGPSKQSGG